MNDKNLDKKWKWLNQDLEKFMKSGDYWNLGSTYYEMAEFVENEGKDSNYLRNLGYQMKLKINEKTLQNISKSKVVTGVEIIACPDSCEFCKALSEKHFSLDDAKKLKPLPEKKCSNKLGCRCVYAPIV